MNGLLPKPKAVPTKRLLALGIGLVLCFSAICASILWEMASKDYRHAKEGATNLVASIASEIDRNIDLYDLSLQAVADGVKLPELGKISRSFARSCCSTAPPQPRISARSSC